MSWLAAAAAALILNSWALASGSDDDDDDATPPPPAQQQQTPPPVAPPVVAPLPPAPRPIAVEPVPVARPIVPAPLPPPPADTSPVSAETVQLAADADRLRGSFTEHDQSAASLHAERNGAATQYYGFTSDIGRKLAIGLPPDDPALTGELAQARVGLERLRTNTAQLITVSNELTDDATTALHLAGLVQQRLGVPGTLPNERAALAAAESKISAVQADIDQRLRGVLAEIGREQRALSVEGQNLDQLARGIASGGLEPELPATASEPPPAPIAVAAPHGGKPGKTAPKHPAVEPVAAPDLDAKPLVTISRDSAGRSYEHQLYAAVADVLQRAPGAGFSVRAATPARASLATQTLEASDLQHRAADVVRSLTTFGLARSRISVVQTTDAAITEPQIQVFAEAGR
jgi:hypothetical protein